MKRMKPLNDVVFRKIFGEEVDKRLLIGFLNAILTTKVNDIELRDDKLQRDSTKDKQGILDLKATLDNGEKVNIEVQQLNQYNMTKRTLFYWAKLYVENFKVKSDYSQLTKTITINILGFSLVGKESFHSRYHVYEDETKERLSDDLEIHFLELSKFKKEMKDLQNPLHRWLLFLMEDGKSKALEEIVMIDNLIKEAEEKLERLGADPKTRQLYESREKQLRDELNRLNGAKAEGIAIGEEKGKEEGKYENKIETAKKLISKGMSTVDISDVTGLTEEEINRLK